MDAGRSAAFALVTGAVSTVPLWRAPKPVRAALLAGTGLVTGGVVFAALTGPDETAPEQEPISARVAATIGGAAGAATAGALALGLVVDREAERFLVRRGVRRPRLVLGALGAAISWATDAFDRRRDADRD